ncbi:MAG: hypothetical protein A2014_02330 [Spirochaetes bacterium GWF1_49_6]|nr:MAG: hypothetical protein A2014_02330 [Spirochaetes bacterium GWF1_49_6]
MFFSIIKRTFWSWWDNLSYAVFTSLLGAANPFYLVIIAGFRWLFAEDMGFILQYKDAFFLVLMGSILNMQTFPTTLAAYSMQAKLIDGETKSYFREYWGELRKVFGKGMIFTLINTTAGLLLGYSILYFRDKLVNLYPWNYILIGLSGWFIFSFLLSQFIMAPLVISDLAEKKEDRLKIGSYYMISLYWMVKKGLVMLGLAIINLLIFFIFTIPAVSPFLTVIPIFAYMGFVTTMHTWTYRYVFDDFPQGKDFPKRSVRDLFSPFSGKLRKQEAEDAEKEVAKEKDK